MMGRQGGDQSQLFYLFNLERRIPACHLLRRVIRSRHRYWLTCAGSWRPFIVTLAGLRSIPNS